LGQGFGQHVLAFFEPHAQSDGTVRPEAREDGCSSTQRWKELVFREERAEIKKLNILFSWNSQAEHLHLYLRFKCSALWPGAKAPGPKHSCWNDHLPSLSSRAQALRIVGAKTRFRLIGPFSSSLFRQPLQSLVRFEAEFL
jgi:hypothetical protein